MNGIGIPSRKASIRIRSSSGLIRPDDVTERAVASYKQNLLKQGRIFTFAEFTGTAEADIEDMFDPEFYLELVYGEYKDALIKRIFQGDLPQHPRIVTRLEQYFQRTPLRSSLRFNPHRPARYFVEHASELAPKISAKTYQRFEALFEAVNKVLECSDAKTAAD
jgi:hypothetical protein